jgi:hypothetical protein
MAQDRDQWRVLANTNMVKLSGSTRSWEILQWPSNWWLLKDSAPWSYFGYLRAHYCSCYHSVQNLLSFHLPSKIIKIRIYKTIISPVVLYGCET